ncbi:hypothetical protein HO173_002899 [Letharia columbiana]|uniref:Uncharacterized protein n=1 Tax=Letharia columbiana TaxID=112416 RepID=A0A8H6L7Z5_9LECA|nr:uncharacterized protein HO173_002899 [Letharia columbiana]KAF6239027.1 hypothetical protein HO173_002899 [Letharia columbiana]
MGTALPTFDGEVYQSWPAASGGPVRLWLKKEHYTLEKELRTIPSDDSSIEGHGDISQGTLAVGIHALRGKKALQDALRSDPPMLIGDIEGKINDGRGTLARLGPDRDGWDQQRLFLLQIGQAFQTISRAAPDGVDGRSCFGESHG